MSFLPAGAEEYSDEDDDYLDNYNHYHKEVTITSPVVESTPITTSKPKPKRNVCLESIASSDGVICLSDIRMAIINGNADYLKQLMEKDNKFFVDTILSAGWTPLMYATNGGHKDIVHYLLERGADPNYHNDNSTPLMAVCGARSDVSEEDLIDCAKSLIKFGANVNALDKYGNSALIYAAKAGKCGLTQELIDNNAEINRANNEGWNALHWAVREGQGKVIERLLSSNDIDITLKTKSSQTAAQIAESKGHQKISIILENIKNKIDDNANGAEDDINSDNTKLSEEEVKILEDYVRPVAEIKCREKSQPKPTNHGELEEFLRQSDRIELLPKFLEHNIGYQDLVTNAEVALLKIGVTEPADIRKICANIVLLHGQDWKRESLKDISLKTTITCPDMLCVMSNVANHLHRIDQTVAYLKNTVTKRPDIMGLNNEVSTKRQVYNEILQALSNSRMLYQEIQSLRDVINAIEDTSEPQTPDLLSIPFTLEDEIDNKCRKSTKYSKGFLFSMIAVGALSVYAVKYGKMNGENTFTFMLNSIPSTLSKLYYKFY